jgi:hypothetical protein
MLNIDIEPQSGAHSHFFLGDGHVESERKAWFVIGLCGAIMIAEIRLL